MIPTSMMSANECQHCVTKLLLAFPNVASDEERCEEIGRKLSAYPYGVALRGVEEYVGKGGDTFLGLPRLMTIIDRLYQEHRQGEADAERARNAAIERRQAEQIVGKFRTATEFIREMSDEEVMSEWEKVLRTYENPTTLEWAKTWGVETVRTNRRFQFHIAELMRRKVA